MVVPVSQRLREQVEGESYQRQAQAAKAALHLALRSEPR
jgi:hypothetical protein